VYSVKIDKKPLMTYAEGLAYYVVLIDKDEDGNISFEEQQSEVLPWRTCHDALSKIYATVESVDKYAFGNNQLDFGGEAELIVSFKADVDGNLMSNRIEKLCFIGFDKNDLLDSIAYTNNNLYRPFLPRIPL
jgi:hypothetical protein